MDRSCNKRISWNDGKYCAHLSKGCDTKCNEFLDEIIKARDEVKLTLVYFNNDSAKFERRCDPREFAEIYAIASQYGWS